MNLDEYLKDPKYEILSYKSSREGRELVLVRTENLFYVCDFVRDYTDEAENVFRHNPDFSKIDSPRDFKERIDGINSYDWRYDDIQEEFWAKDLVANVVNRNRATIVWDKKERRAHKSP
jgi:hypothetical protein